MQSGLRVALGLALMTFLALSGCAGSKDDSGGQGTDPGNGTGPGDGSRTGTDPPTTTTGSATTTGPGQDHLAELSASLRNGTAPLAVSFGIKATGDAPNKWTVEFGDGAKMEGATFPGVTSHNYTAAGTFVAKLTVAYAQGSPATDSLSIGVLPAGVDDAGYTLNVTAPITAPWQGGNACLRGVVDETNPALCAADQAKAAFAQDAQSNGTFFLWYDVPVATGATALGIHAGSKATQTCQASPSLPVLGVFTACVPDVDIYVLNPAGEVDSAGVSAAAFEEYAYPAPAVGTWSVVVIYYAGPPNASMETNIGVFY